MRWRGLLVSVRNAAEAAAALAGGAAIIDIKEPHAGPLGAASAAVIAEIAQVVGQRKPWTMACGELLAGIDATVERIREAVAAVSGAALPPAAIKVGLAGMAHEPWRERLAAVHERLPAEIAQVAVVYADWKRVVAPAPADVIDAAASLGCTVLLVDTADKSAGGLLDSVPLTEIAGWVAAARRRGLAVALAGKIALPEIPAVMALVPDVVALRSAVCSNSRLGTVQTALVREAVIAYGGDGSAELGPAADAMQKFLQSFGDKQQ